MITIKELSVKLAGFTLKNLNLELREGEFFMILGPTGAGKTLLLEAIAGLVPVTSGRVFIDGKEVTHLAPERRGIGIVYQDYSLFPHLNIKENILYGTNFKGACFKRERFENLVDLLGLRPLLLRLPDNLSGGEKQRVALARALTVDPGLLLLDEPLSAVDAKFKNEIRRELKRLHHSLRNTFLMVSHDFEDVLHLAERLAVMKDGEIVQIGSPTDVFQRPASSFVAEFVGVKNLLAARFSSTQAEVQDLVIELGRESLEEEGYLVIRPEEIVLSRESFRSSIRNTFPGKVTKILQTSPYVYEVIVEVQGVSLSTMITRASLENLEITLGSSVYISFKATAVHTFF